MISHSNMRIFKIAELFEKLAVKDLEELLKAERAKKPEYSRRSKTIEEELLSKAKLIGDNRPPFRVEFGSEKFLISIQTPLKYRDNPKKNKGNLNNFATVDVTFLDLDNNIISPEDVGLGRLLINGENDLDNVYQTFSLILNSGGNIEIDQ